MPFRNSLVTPWSLILCSTPAPRLAQARNPLCLTWESSTIMITKWPLRLHSGPGGWRALKVSQLPPASSRNKDPWAAELLSKTSFTCDLHHVKSFYCYSCLRMTTAICVSRFFSPAMLAFFLLPDDRGHWRYTGPQLSFAPFIVLGFVPHRGIWGQ